ncbi:ABC transporter permease subunit [Acidaminobacter sp.]|uniref:ABC transporter permease subunit n=1 Tax=Acidaminobacter sp. TaxID=1872102 RepID=UPI0013829A57|nr:ABC transporter permease [Acidaminobacter sp.]MDK9710132.1 ABC transporter permease [Acidaminobacter sp.]MZQ98782.1 ABC transporter permease [Acidaminobacter sp.]
MLKFRVFPTHRQSRGSGTDTSCDGMMFHEKGKNQLIANFLRKHLLTLIFGVLCWVGFNAAGVSLGFVGGELYVRTVRNAVTILALLIPILAGMGLNFAIIIGAMISQLSMIIISDFSIPGLGGIFAAFALTLMLCFIFGHLIGRIMNAAKGKEMIVGIVTGYLGSNMYQMLFLVGYGTLIMPRNPEILLSRGIGMRNMIDIQGYRAVFMNSPLLIFTIVCAAAGFIYYLQWTKLGRRFAILGEGMQTAQLLGIDVDKTRIAAIILSTILAGVGHLMFIIEMGNVNVYTGHLNIDIFSSAALLAGGASLKYARIRHVFIGLFLFHTLFIVSPLAGQNIFNSAAIGEYFRSFAAYATIVLALVLNQRKRA